MVRRVTSQRIGLEFASKHMRVSTVLINYNICANGGDEAILLAQLADIKATFGGDVKILAAAKADQVEIFRRHGCATLKPVSEILAVKAPNRDVGAAWYWLAWKLLALNYHVKKKVLVTMARQDWLRRMIERMGFWRGAVGLLNSYRSANLIVSSGGTYVTPKYSQEILIIEQAVISALNIPQVMYTQSVGDFSERPERKRLAKAISNVRRYAVRDHQSEQNLNGLNFCGEIVRRADAVFGLYPPVLRNIGGGDESIAVINVRPWASEKDASSSERRYIAAHRGLISYLIEQMGFAVEILSTCQGMPTYTDDAAYAFQAFGDLMDQYDGKLRLIKGKLKVEDVLDHLSRARVSINTRMHMSILSISANCPCIAVAYEFKTTELFHQLGLEENVIDYEDVTDVGLLDRVKTVLLEEHDSRESIYKAHIKMSAQSSGVLRDIY